jgi:hypothetical protein
VERVVLNALPQGVAALPANIAPSGDSFAMVFMRSESTLWYPSLERVRLNLSAELAQSSSRITVAEAAETDAVVGSGAASALLWG